MSISVPQDPHLGSKLLTTCLVAGASIVGVVLAGALVRGVVWGVGALFGAGLVGAWLGGCPEGSVPCLVGGWLGVWWWPWWVACKCSI
jgi:hypothetical protein